MLRYTIIILVLLHAVCLSSMGQQLDRLSESKAVNFSGNVDFNTIFYNSTGIPARYIPFNYVLSGTPVLSLYGIDVPFSFIIGKQQSGFAQPFNQFGLSPSYKAVTVHAGYRNLVWSPFTLGGHTFLGAAVEVQSGKLRLGAMYGQLNRATAMDTTQSLFFSNFSYKRNGVAMRVGVGSDENFFDVIAMKASDVASSINTSREITDSLGITPAENRVMGFNTRLSFFNNRITFESDGAVSMYTHDIGAPSLQEFSDARVRRIANLAHANTSSELYGAIQAGIRYRHKNMSVRFIYRYVDPGYQSMGAYWLNNDLENWTVAPAFTILNNKLRFAGSLGIQRDDLSNTKRASAKRVIGSANVSADIAQNLSVDLSFSNYSINQTVKTIRFADSLKVVQSSRQLAIMPRYVIPREHYSHILTFAANLSQARELNPVRLESGNSDISTENYMINYMLNLTRLAASVFISLNNTQMKSDLMIDGNRGVTLGGSKSLLENNFHVSATGGYLFSERNGEDGVILTGSLQCRYRVARQHAFRLTAFYTSNTPDNPSEVYPRFTETRVEVGYGFFFTSDLISNR